MGASLYVTDYDHNLPTASDLQMTTLFYLLMTYNEYVADL